MTHAQAQRIADLTRGYRADASFEVQHVADDCITLTLKVYNLVYDIKPDGHGTICTTNNRFLDRF